MGDWFVIIEKIRLVIFFFENGDGWEEVGIRMNGKNKVSAFLHLALHTNFILTRCCLRVGNSFPTMFFVRGPLPLVRQCVAPLVI